MIPNATATRLLILVTIIVALLGGGVTALAFRAAHRAESRPLTLFSIGFATLTGGVLAGSFAALFSGWTTTESVLLQGSISALGFGLLLRSFYDVSASRT